MRVSRRSFALRAAGSMAALAAAPFARALRPRPKLCVFIICEQFRADYLGRLESWLGQAGFRRLMEQGSFYPDCRMEASTFTTSGMATLATGTWPQSHGIVADSWYDTGTRRIVHASPEILEATTLTDQIPKDRRYRLYAVGTSPNHTAFFAGRAPAAMFAMDERGEFTARGDTPAWFASWQKAHSPSDQHDAPWVALRAKPGSLPLRVLRYDAARPRDFAFLYKASPFGMTAEFDLARELIGREKLGQGDPLDYLVLAPGATALLGYEVGADSPLMDQLVLQLDRQIEMTLDVLNRTPGAGNYNLVFTAAHGAPDAPAAEDRRQLSLAGEAVAMAVSQALSARFKNVSVDRYVYPFLYLRIDPAWLGDRRQLRRAAGQFALEVPGITGYFTADGDCSHGGEWQRRFRNSFHSTRSGDVMLSYAPGRVEDYGAGRGISYGSLYDYDCRVPLLLYGAQFRAATFEHTVTAVDVAPTLARAAGLAFPSSAVGRVLGEAFAGPAVPSRERK